MPRVEEIAALLGEWAPLELAEDWDNVGLLCGDPGATVQRVLTCLTLSPDVAEEAVAERAELVVTHHPLPFRPLQRLTTATPEGKALWTLAGGQVAVFSLHTAYDSAAAGINEQLADLLALDLVEPLVAHPRGLGAGRAGLVSGLTTLGTLAERLKQAWGLPNVQLVGSPEREVRRVAVACGSGAELIPAAQAQGCDVVVTGEMRFHQAVAAAAEGLAVLLVGHYASERFAMEALAARLAAARPELTVWASRRERDPLAWH